MLPAGTGCLCQPHARRFDVPRAAAAARRPSPHGTGTDHGAIASHNFESQCWVICRNEDLWQFNEPGSADIFACLCSKECRLKPARKRMEFDIALDAQSQNFDEESALNWETRTLKSTLVPPRANYAIGAVKGSKCAQGTAKHTYNWCPTLARGRCRIAFAEFEGHVASSSDGR